MADRETDLRRRPTQGRQSMTIMEPEPQPDLRSYEQLYLEAPVGLALLDPDLRFVRINQRLASLHGMPIEDHLGRCLADILPDFAPLIEPPCRRVLASGRAALDVDLGASYPRPRAGSWSASFSPVRTADGEVALVSVLVQEVTPAQRIKTALEKRVRFEAFVADMTADLVTVADHEHPQAMQRWLERLVDLLEVDCCLLLGIDANEVHPVANAGLIDGRSTADLSRAFPWTAGMLRERRRVSVHRLGDLPDAAAADRDSCVLAAIKSYIALPIVVANSLVGGICLCTRRLERSWSGDTERGLRLIGEICTGSMLRAQASTDLRAAEALRRGVLSSLKDQIVVVDDAGVIIDANEAWLAAGGEGGPRIGVGVNYLDTCRAAADPEAAKALAGIEAVLSGRERFFSAEYHCSAPGGLRHLVMSVTPLRGRAGAVVTHTDVTRLKESEEALRRLSGGLISVQESERRRIARDLHDDVCQRLTALSIGLKALTQRPRAVEESQEVLTQLLAQVAQLNADVETLSTQLHPIWVTQLGLAAALERLCADIGRQYGLPIRLLKRCSFRQLSEEAMVCLYRVGQEALRNVVRHSRASAAQVQLAHTPRLLSMRITDDGIGFDAEVAMRGGGFGLLSMRERVAVLGGHLSIRSRPGKGTQVVVRVPMPPPA